MVEPASGRRVSLMRNDTCLRPLSDRIPLREQYPANPSNPPMRSTRENFRASMQATCKAARVKEPPEASLRRGGLRKETSRCAAAQRDAFNVGKQTAGGLCSDHYNS